MEETNIDRINDIKSAIQNNEKQINLIKEGNTLVAGTKIERIDIIKSNNVLIRTILKRMI